MILTAVKKNFSKSIKVIFCSVVIWQISSACVTEFAIAIIENDVEKVQSLINKEVLKQLDPFTYSGLLILKGGGFICLAAKKGNLKIVSMLIDNGFDPLRCDVGGFNPLHLATLNKNTDVVKLLLEKTNIDKRQKNNFEETALDIARKQGLDDEIIKLLDFQSEAV